MMYVSLKSLSSDKIGKIITGLRKRNASFIPGIVYHRYINLWIKDAKLATKVVDYVAKSR